jgi:hypothetical protein
VAIIHPDLSVDPHRSAAGARPAWGGNAVGVGRIISTRRRLTDLFGPPRSATHHQLDRPEWRIATPNGSAELLAVRSDPDQRHDPAADLNWLVLATGPGPLPWLCKVITGSTAGLGPAHALATPPGVAAAPATDASSAATQDRLAALAWAYADYLYLYRQGIEAWLRTHLRPIRLRRARQHLPAQLHLQVEPLLKVLYRYEWATSTPAQRRTWTAAPCPLDPAGRSDLERWRTTGRWLHRPTAPPRRSDTDLAAQLLALADRHAEHRREVVTINPYLRMAAYDEYEATLRALTTSTGPLS